jgi:hypothetical protein
MSPTYQNGKLISLCLITGNCEEYIERCLSSFAPIADEIVVVRAIGNQEPDATLDIARDKFGAITAEYRNSPPFDSWPHIDNFARARQMSFSLASGTYCFWCDTDDILVSGAEKIRKHAADGAYACYIFPYDVFGKNVIVPRERMMLKLSGIWENAVHEAFRFDIEPVSTVMDESVVIQHLPHLTKTGSNDRNLRILESIPDDQMTVGLKYHYFGELMGAGRIQEAIPLAIQLITEEDLGKDERYDLLLSLCIQTSDLKQRTDLLHEAFKADPARREALGVLACNAMDSGNPEWALAFARQMVATATPEIQSWNSRQPFYGYVGDDIYQQALRVNGLFAEAEIIRREILKKQGGPRIALLHATRGRPVMASKCRKAWHDLAAEPGRVEHIFAIDDDDPESAILRRFHHIVVPHGGGCVRAWNMAAHSTSAPVIVQLSDDWIPVPKWDDLILERIGDVNEPRVLAISDGIRSDQLLCMAICTRNYLTSFGDYFLFHPWFKGVYSDNWFTHQAYERSAVIEARDIQFTHNHPVAGAEWDATYRAQNSGERYEEGKAIYHLLLEGWDWSSVPGWFNYWPFYQEIAEILKDGDHIAEVGVWLGRSVIYLAQELKRQGKSCEIHTYDTFQGEDNQPEHQAVVDEYGGSIREAFYDNVKRCGVSELFSVTQCDSAAGASFHENDEMAFVFIDAAHDYESVKRDIQAWLPKVKPGGILAGHDIQHEEVQRAVKELLPAAKVCGPVWVYRAGEVAK